MFTVLNPPPEQPFPNVQTSEIRPRFEPGTMLPLIGASSAFRCTVLNASLISVLNAYSESAPNSRARAMARSAILGAPSQYASGARD